MAKEKLTKKAVQEFVKQLFNEQIPFNRYVGLDITVSTPDFVEIKIKKKPELVGNFYYDSLHGGVIATILDVAGGLVAMVNTVERMDDLNEEALRKRLVNVGTIDLRIDYLKPGRGEEFTASARVIRHGSKVAVTRMEMHNEKDEEIALGTATYLVG